MAARWRSIVALPEGGRLAHHNMRIYAAKDCCDFRLWLQADIQSPEIEVCLTPNNALLFEAMRFGLHRAIDYNYFEAFAGKPIPPVAGG